MLGQTPMVDTSLLEQIKSQFRLNTESIHGINHWIRVETIGLFLAKETGADPTVISHFAYLHDSQRINNGIDTKHGNRAAEYTKNLLFQGCITLTKSQTTNLLIACKNHSERDAIPRNITIATCWDADRLDLWRLGIEPNPHYLYTEFAKTFRPLQLSRAVNMIQNI